MTKQPFTVSYPKSRHCPRGEDELKNYVEDVGFATKILQGETPKVKGLKRDIAIALKAQFVIPEIRAALAPLYELDSEVETHLFNHSVLVNVLIIAKEQITNYFDQVSKCVLVVLRDGNSEKLFVEIHTNLDPDTALKNLEAFDTKWWFKVPDNIHLLLEFTLEFD